MSHVPRSVQETYAEARRYLMGEGTLNRVLAQLANDLEQHQIDYVVIGATALLVHGYPRLTEDIDLVLTPEGLDRFHRELVGLSYAAAFPNARKRFRSTRDGSKIEVITTDEYPGDGQPKPVMFPTPPADSTEIDGIRYVTLEKLIELKLASGITAPDRLKDLADVQELIKIHNLTPEFASHLNPFVRDKFVELSESVAKGRDQSKSV